jgi:hypothetical protein
MAGEGSGDESLHGSSFLSEPHPGLIFNLFSHKCEISSFDDHHASDPACYRCTEALHVKLPQSALRLAALASIWSFGCASNGLHQFFSCL